MAFDAAITHGREFGNMPSRPLDGIRLYLWREAVCTASEAKVVCAVRSLMKVVRGSSLRSQLPSKLDRYRRPPIPRQCAHLRDGRRVKHCYTRPGTARYRLAADSFVRDTEDVHERELPQLMHRTVHGWCFSPLSMWPRGTASELDRELKTDFNTLECRQTTPYASGLDGGH